MDHQLQALGRFRVITVGNVHFAIGKAVILQFQHDALQCAVLAAGLAQHLQLAALTGLTNDPDAQHPCHSGNSRLHTAIAGQIGQRFQRKQQMRVLVVSHDRLADLVKLHPDPDEIPQTLCQQTQLRPGGQAVQNKNTGLRVRFLVFFRCQQCSIVAAGQCARDGGNKDLLRTLISSQPVCHIGAGGAGLALVSTQRPGHAHGIQSAVIQIFLFIRDDLQRHTGKVYARQGIQAGRRIHNDLGFHKMHAPNLFCDSRSFFIFRALHALPPAWFSVHCRHHSSFSKTCQGILYILSKVLKIR